MPVQGVGLRRWSANLQFLKGRAGRRTRRTLFTAEDAEKKLNRTCTLKSFSSPPNPTMLAATKPGGCRSWQPKASSQRLLRPRRALPDELFHHCLAHQVRRQQSLRQNEVVKLLLIELRTHRGLGVFSQSD